MNQKKLKRDDINPFFLETDPRNPYGPNFEELPYETKVYYKFNKIRKHVHFDEPDQKIILKSNIQFASQMMGGFLSTILTAYLIKKHMIKPALPRFWEYCDDFSHLYYGILGSAVTTMVYSKISSDHIQDVCIPFIKKYQDEAIKNGFENYEISNYRRFDVHQELADIRNKK